MYDIFSIMSNLKLGQATSFASSLTSHTSRQIPEMDCKLSVCFTLEAIVPGMCGQRPGLKLLGLYMTISLPRLISCSELTIGMLNIDSTAIVERANR